LRHPIAVEEADHSLVIFVGHGRGGLAASDRADVIGLAQTWRREATGPINADLPVDTPNAAAAADAFREIQSLLTAAGVPPRGITVHRYHPGDPRQMATIRLTYPKISAVAGPCGLWPEDLGPSINDKSYLQNKDYYNFGCAYQRNMAAMIDNPSDLAQPRSETPAYTARRSEAFEKYRKGLPTTTVYPDAEKAKLSDTGK
jgi:pilus assembly protein CpaD